MRCHTAEGFEKAVRSAGRTDTQSRAMNPREFRRRKMLEKFSTLASFSLCIESARWICSVVMRRKRATVSMMRRLSGVRVGFIGGGNLRFKGGLRVSG